MIRINIIVEGQTEEAFVSRVLLPYFAHKNIIVNARRVETGRKRGRIFRGGVDCYTKIRNDVTIWLKEDTNAWVTTMFDLYALPNDFPNISIISGIIDPYKKVSIIETAFAEDIGYNRFIPYIQLHEFEAILLAEPMKIMNFFIEDKKGCEKLESIVLGFETCEHINHTPENAPSKRIINEIPLYEKLKMYCGSGYSGGNRASDHNAKMQALCRMDK